MNDEKSNDPKNWHLILKNLLSSTTTTQFQVPDGAEPARSDRRDLLLQQWHGRQAPAHQQQGRHLHPVRVPHRSDTAYMSVSHRSNIAYMSVVVLLRSNIAYMSV